MSGILRRRRMALFSVAVLGAAIAANQVAVAKSSTPPAKFTANVKADGSLGAQGQGDNEPQVTVDQSGTAYVTWQGGAEPSVASTANGQTFSPATAPDPNHNDIGDVALAATTAPKPGMDTSPRPVGANGVFWGDIGPTLCGALEIREATSANQGTNWSPTDAACDPNQVDRPWMAAYTPAQYRGTAAAIAHTQVFFEHHDFTTSDITVTRSFDGGTTWNQVPQLAEQPGSFQ